jgi:hypothetical protein
VATPGLSAIVISILLPAIFFSISTILSTNAGCVVTAVAGADAERKFGFKSIFFAPDIYFSKPPIRETHFSIFCDSSSLS